MLRYLNHPRALAILLYIFAGLYFGVHFVMVASGAGGLGPANRRALLDEAQWLLSLWASLVIAAVALSICVWRFEGFGRPFQRSVVVISCIVGVVAAVGFEWWNALYFLLPAYVLAMSSRSQSHA